MADRILGEFVKIKEYKSIEVVTENSHAPVTGKVASVKDCKLEKTEAAAGKEILARNQEIQGVGSGMRNFGSEKGGEGSGNGGVRWVWIERKLVKCRLVSDEKLEHEGPTVEMQVLENAGVEIIFGTVGYPKKSDPSSDYVIESDNGKRYGVLLSLKKKKEPSLFDSNITLKNLENEILCEAHLSLKSTCISDGIQARYYPGLYLNKKDETWKVVVRMEAFSRNVSFRRSDGRLCNGKYTLLKEIPFPEEARPLEKDSSMTSECGPVSPITEDEHYLMLELSQPTGGRLVISPELARFECLPPACCIGLQFTLKTPLSPSGVQASASEVNGKVVIEANGVSWGIESKKDIHHCKSSSSLWSRLEQAAGHHESYHMLRQSSESREKAPVVHGEGRMQQMNTDDFKSPKSILKQSSLVRKSSEKKAAFADTYPKGKEVSNVQWKEEPSFKVTHEEKKTEGRERTNSETRIISERKTYFENGQIVTVVRDFNVSEDGERVPVDTRLSDTIRQTSSQKQLTKPLNSQPQMPIKKTSLSMRGNKKQPGAPEQNLMVAFEEFIGAMPVKVEPELLFPLFKEMTARAIGLISEVSKKPSPN